MSPAALGAAFAANKTAVLGTGAAAVVGLALVRKRKAAAVPAGATAGATIPGTNPAAAVVPGGYDSSASDVYSALQSELESLVQTRGTGITDAPAPISSTLFAPTGSGNYVRYGNGTVAEVESDGSLYGIAPGEDWKFSGERTAVQLPWATSADGGPAYGDKVSNLAGTAKKTS